MFGGIAVDKEIYAGIYAYACALESLKRCANAPTHAITYSILLNISFLSMTFDVKRKDKNKN